MAINDNSLDLSKYRGEVRRCPQCGSLPPGARLDALTSGRACKLCLGREFVSVCLNCDGTGIYSGRTVWDGGRSEHRSTCTPCGGSGVFPVKRPTDWADKPAPESAVPVESKSVPASAPAPFRPDPTKLPPPLTMNSGVMLPGGAVVK